MLDALYEFFQNTIFWTSGDNPMLDDFLSSNFNIGDFNLPMYEYLQCLFSLISLVIILVLCCLFIYRLIRLVGRLFSGGSL